MNHKFDPEGSADRRTDARLFVNAPVEITNLDATMGSATEQVRIEDFGDFGCRFSMRGPVREGDSIAIQLLRQDGTRALDVPVKFFTVKWVIGGIEISTVGARVLEGDKLEACKLAMKKIVSAKSDS